MGINLPTRRLVSQEDSAMIAKPEVPRSKFEGSFSVKMPFDAGFLYPFHLEEVYPGDHIRYDIIPFVRTATPLFPIMDSQRIDIHCFFVPHRLVWSNWVKLQGEQTAPGDSIAFSVPQITSTGNGFAVGSLGDYFGLPTVGQCLAPLSVSLLPFRAYNLVCYQWFRDENLTTYNSASLRTADLAEPEASFAIRRRAKSHDRFTSALPWPQKFVAPSINSPVTGIGVSPIEAGAFGPWTIKETVSPTNGGTGLQGYDNKFTTSVAAFDIAASDATGGATPLIFAQTDINTFRAAMAVQVYLERLARAGTRYTEMLSNIWGVNNPDARLQRTEYIGGGSTPLQFTPIAQTAPVAGVGVGALGGAGTAAGSAKASYSATEHGFIVCILSVKTELSYSQGVHPMWDRKTLYDFYNPAFAGLGEAAILRRQIYATGQSANDDVVFGYQERWQELRTHESSVRGLFRPTAAGNIDEWHLSQQFLSAPTLGDTFIRDEPPMSRVFQAGALTAGQQYLGDIHIKCEMTRALPVYGTPVSLGRF